MTLLGEAGCLAAALGWSIAVTLFRPTIRDEGAWAVSLARNWLAVLLFGVTLIFAGQIRVLFSASPEVLGMMALSGLVGMAIGDTALFAAVDEIGVYRTLLFQSLGPVFAAILAVGFFGEQPSSLRFLGGAIVLVGVAVVIRPEGNEQTALSLRGIFYAILAAAGQAGGIVLAKDALAELPLLSASFLRLLAGGLGVAIYMLLSGRGRRIVDALLLRGALRRVIFPTFLGSYICILFMMAGIAWAPASVAAVLLSTAPVFSLFIDHRLARKTIPIASLFGVLLSIIGIAVLTIAG